MKDKRMTLFNFVRGAAAILISLAVGTVFIFLTFALAEKHYTFGECLENTGEALRYMLIGPLFKKRRAKAPSWRAASWQPSAAST